MRTRVLAALVFAPPFLCLVWYGRAPLVAACLAVAALMLWEFYSLTLGHGAYYLKAVGFALGALVAVTVLGWLRPDIVLAVAPLAVVALLTALLLRPEPISQAMSHAGLLALGALYAGGLIQYLALLRGLDAGLALALMALFCTWGADTGAYFAGRLFGRHKLYPKISPGKTVEGAFGGLAAAIGVAYLVRALPNLLPAAWHGTLGLDRAHFGPPLSDLHVIAVGCVVMGLGLAGDLCESMLKRSVGAKDSSQLIPGHGGIFDRFDAVVFVAPGLYAFAAVITS